VKTPTRIAAGLLLPAIVMAAGACSSGSGAPTAAHDTSATAPMSASLTDSATASATTSAGATTNQSTPAGAMKLWLKQVLSGDYATQCAELATVASASPGPSPFPTAECVSSLRDLAGNFTTDGLTPQTPVTISTVDQTGQTATIDGTAIHALGSTLTALMTAHSKGVAPGQLSLSFQLTRSNGTWYVAGFNLNV
jgi:hypothetical protein